MIVAGGAPPCAILTVPSRWHGASRRQCLSTATMLRPESLLVTSLGDDKEVAPLVLVGQSTRPTCRPRPRRRSRRSRRFRASRSERCCGGRSGRRVLLSTPRRTSLQRRPMLLFEFEPKKLPLFSKPKRRERRQPPERRRSYACSRCRRRRANGRSRCLRGQP